MASTITQNTQPSQIEIEISEYACRQAADLVCQHCGVIGEVAVSQPDRGPHKLRADCTACGSFIKWLSPLSADERQARAEHFRRAEIAKRPVTPDQLRVLRAMGWSGPEPQNRQQAIDIIARLCRGASPQEVRDER
jgi:hypothetical protein